MRSIVGCVVVRLWPVIGCGGEKGKYVVHNSYERSELISTQISKTSAENFRESDESLESLMARWQKMQPQIHVLAEMSFKCH